MVLYVDINVMLYNGLTGGSLMKAVTIRGVDQEIAKKLKQTAMEQGKSVNQLILEFIKKSLGVEKGKKYSRVYNDLDSLFGRWTEDEFEQIQGKITQERHIDQELWR